ncbi:phage terminase small subunit-like protein [Rhizobium etli]|uniref:Phage terminase small subunit-like protein n=1 Tax=Rhizobium etli TaxID=29449 RepID=A0AAN1BDM4_RHIET|nr:phage terminase small subunit-like protein [Rhizobium etli]
MGRPTKFSQALAEKICDRIADRESLRSICRDEDMPSKSTVLSWLADEEKAAFRARYALAREIMADSFVDELVEIADDRSDDWVEKKNAAGETTGWQENGEAIRRSQLRIATRQWVAEKLRPKKYGTRSSPNRA